LHLSGFLVILLLVLLSVSITIFFDIGFFDIGFVNIGFVNIGCVNIGCVNIGLVSISLVSISLGSVNIGLLGISIRIGLIGCGAGRGAQSAGCRSPRKGWFGGEKRRWGGRSTTWRWGNQIASIFKHLLSAEKQCVSDKCELRKCRTDQVR
jgi:hypothetical protein